MRLNRGKQKLRIWGISAGIIIAVLVLVFIFHEPPQTQLSPQGRSEAGELASETAAKQAPVVVMTQIKKNAPIEYQNLEKDASLKTMMESRKKNIGIKNSLDMIVKSDETFTIGKTTVSMQKILKKAFAIEGKVFQEEIGKSGSTRPGKIKEYGIYVVQPGDNIWNIHFRILRDYYADKGIDLEELADEPATSGMSSGIGKILKFSETMVIIYNMIEEKVTQDVNIIESLSKIVVYNMDAVFSLLEQINFKNVDRLQFDGKNIWIPAKKN